MGCTQMKTQSQYGQMYIKTNEQSYKAGDTVKGIIYLQIIKEGFPGTLVVISLKGYEQSIWWEHRNSLVKVNKEKKRWVFLTNRNKVKKIIYNNSVCIHQFETDSIPLGQYEFPFQFELQKDIPGTYFKHCFSYDAEIQYNIEATIETQNKNFNAIKDIVPLVIRQQYHLQHYNLIDEKIQNIQTYFCINKGQTYIRCIFEKNSYFSGEYALFKIIVDNSRCTIDVEAIQTKIVNYVTLVTEKGKQIMFQKCIAHKKIDGIPAHTQFDDYIQVSMLLIDEKKPETPIPPSTKGTYINSSYELVAECVMKGCTCCKTRPKAELPIYIIASENQLEEINVPDQWGPQIYEMTTIKFGENNFVNDYDNEIEQKLVQNN